MSRVGETIAHAAQRTIDRVPPRWRARAASLGKPVVAGGLFAVGALALGRLLGPGVAREIGQRGGEGFAEGVATAQAALSRASGRGSRFG